MIEFLFYFYTFFSSESVAMQFPEPSFPKLRPTSCAWIARTPNSLFLPLFSRRSASLTRWGMNEQTRTPENEAEEVPAAREEIPGSWKCCESSTLLPIRRVNGYVVMVVQCLPGQQQSPPFSATMALYRALETEYPFLENPITEHDSGRDHLVTGEDDLHDLLEEITQDTSPPPLWRVVTANQAFQAVGVGSNELARKRASHLGLLVTLFATTHVPMEGLAEAHGDLLQWLQRATFQFRKTVRDQGLAVEAIGGPRADVAPPRPTKAPRLR